MATLHLELDIDSDVHPELYVRLASIERSAARQEKLRQLAATGLIWEIVRLHGPAFSDPDAVVHGPSTLTAFSLADEPVPAVDAASVADRAPVVPQDVPLLVDVVDEAEIAGGAGDTTPPLDAPPAAPVDGGDGVAPGTPETPFASALEPPSAPRRSARMKRMRDSGLFQGG